MRNWKKILSILILTLLLLTILFTVKLTQQRQEIRKKAAEECVKPFIVSVSKEKNDTPSTSITMGSDFPRYYLHLNQRCSTILDARLCLDPQDPSCSQYRDYDPWGFFELGANRTDAEGIARIDVIKQLVPTGTYTAKFRPHGKNDTWWSNPITTTYTSYPEPIPLPTINASEYYLYEPGYTFIYKSENFAEGTSSLPYICKLQMEEKTDWCGITTIPWRYTKNNTDAYWSPYMPKFLITADSPNGRPRTHISFSNGFRWFVADQNYSPPNSNFLNYIWGVGDKRYLFDSNNPEHSINMADPFTSSTYGYLFGTLADDVPSYLLTPKRPSIPYLEFDYKYNPMYNPSATPPASCPLTSILPSYNENTRWMLREELTNININNPPFVYNGEALRIDYYEGYIDNNDDGQIDTLLRETWYLVKNIGLVQVLQKTFNPKTNHFPNLTYCSDDSDCFGDTITSPHVKMTLSRYFLNPPLEIKVSKDGVNYSDYITTTKEEGYWLKATDTTNHYPYLGYLEAKLETTGQIFKWEFVNNDGTIHLSGDKLSGAPMGETTARFRIWVPNENFINEQRITDTDVPWSNPITIKLVSEILPTPITTRLSFKIKFQGILGQGANKNVRVILKQNRVEKYRFDSVAVNSDTGGIYSGTTPEITADTYGVFIKGPAHLQKNFGSVTISSGMSTQNWSATPLLAGDVWSQPDDPYHDNKITTEDVISVLNMWTDFSVNVTPGTIQDLNGDNKISDEDIRILLVNYSSPIIYGQE